MPGLREPIRSAAGHREPRHEGGGTGLGRVHASLFGTAVRVKVVQHLAYVQGRALGPQRPVYGISPQA
jgi:hypothetical protein